MSRAPQWNAQLIQHYYSPFGTTQLEKKVKNFNLSGPQGPRIYNYNLNQFLKEDPILRSNGPLDVFRIDYFVMKRKSDENSKIEIDSEINMCT